jgi:hypothetical protein
MTSIDATAEALLDLARRLLRDSEDMAATDPASAGKLADEAYAIMRDHGLVDRFQALQDQAMARSGSAPLRSRGLNGAADRAPTEDEQEEADLNKLLTLHRRTVAPPEAPLSPNATRLPNEDGAWRRMIASWGLIALAFLIGPGLVQAI